jgi:hypothetical protein
MRDIGILLVGKPIYCNRVRLPNAHGNMTGEDPMKIPATFAAALAGALAMPCHAAVAPADVLAQATIPITQARPNTGSRIRRPLPQLTIPATEAYDKLTAEQRHAFRSLFTNLAESDEPPYPVEGLLPVAKALAFALSDGPVEGGELFLTVRVDENGEAQQTSVFATPSPRISREAAAVLMKTRYKPATCAGKPCTSEFPFMARFE